MKSLSLLVLVLALYQVAAQYSVSCTVESHTLLFHPFIESEKFVNVNGNAAFNIPRAKTDDIFQHYLIPYIPTSFKVQIIGTGINKTQQSSIPQSSNYLQNYSSFLIGAMGNIKIPKQKNSSLTFQIIGTAKLNNKYQAKCYGSIKLVPILYQNRQPVYRYHRVYDKQNQYYFSILSTLPSASWILDGIAFYVPVNMANIIPVYQLHYDLASPNQRFRYKWSTLTAQLLKLGWVYDGYAFGTLMSIQDAQLKPVYYYYKQIGNGDTISVLDIEDNWTKNGWKKGVQVFYAYKKYMDSVNYFNL